MTKNKLKKIAEKYGANVVGLMDCLKEHGFDNIEDTTEFDVIRVIYISAERLLYSRIGCIEENEDGDKMTYYQYLEDDKHDLLIKDYVQIEQNFKFVQNMNEDTDEGRRLKCFFYDMLRNDLDYAIAFFTDLKRMD